MRAGALIVVVLLWQIGLAAARGNRPSDVESVHPNTHTTPGEQLPDSQDKEPANQPAAARALRSLPLDSGLPLIVQAGLSYIQIHEVNENKGTFSATVDMRLRWLDQRLRYSKDEVTKGFYEFRGEEAATKLAEIWSPTVRLLNLAEGTPLQSTGLRIFSDGSVEMIVRTNSVFKADFDATRFPFDKQVLTIQLSSDKETMSQIEFQVLQADLNFSRAYEGIVLDGWTVGLVSLNKLVSVGWYGEFCPGVTVGLEIHRQTIKMAAPIFIPLLASLVIPLFAVWMNGTKDGEFTVEAFELGNVIVGGLFAIIALNFTINSTYSLIASGDNTVTRLFGLNYIALAVSLAIVVLLYRYNVPKRLFGQYVQVALFDYLTWAVPVLSFGTAVAYVVAAMF
jgi:hypothetical protein